MINFLNSYKKNLNFIFLLFLNIIHFQSYKVFSLSVLAFCFFLIKNRINLDKIEISLLSFIPITFYGNLLSKIFFEYPRQSSIFWDMQDFLHFINCNVDDATLYIYKFINEERGCVDNIGYGLFTNFINLKFDIWIFTITLFLIFSFLSYLFFLLNDENKILLLIFLISPSFNFLLFSLNADIFVVVYFVYFFKKKNYNLNLIDYLILGFLIQIKVYPIALLAGIILLNIIDKTSLRKLYITTAYLFINLIPIVFNLVILKTPMPKPYSYTRTFGVYHDFLLIKETIGFNELIYLAPVLLAVLIILMIKYPNLIISFIEINELEKINYEKFVVFFPTALLINSFQNFGYKFLFNFFLIYLIFNAVGDYSKLFLILTCLTQTTYYLIGYGFENNLINNFILLISKTNFYIFYFLIGYYFLNSVKKIYT